MALFAGKSPSERNKTIAAIVLGALALFALYMAFGPSFRSKASPNVTSPSPSPSGSGTSSSNAGNPKLTMPTPAEQVRTDTSVPIVYNGPIATATDVGRNIFAFYEPPPPCRENCPTPVPPPVKPPTPAPTPQIQLAYIMPQSLFAGTGAFRLEVNGDKFTPDTKIYFNQSQMPTTFVTAQRLTAEIPAALIASEGPKQVIVQSAVDGKLYSNQLMLNVQQAPTPQFEYIGMIGRKRFNNDTAYFQETGKPLPTSARLNDVVGGRFRVVSISAAQAVVEDVSLGFRYKKDLVQATTVTAAGSSGGRNGFPGDVYQNNPQMQNIPGIPNGIPRYVPPQVTTKQPNPQRPQTDKDKKDVDDNDDTDN